VKRLLAPAATVIAVAVALRVALATDYLNYDARYALLWARDALRGFTPDYEAPFAPTPHPLSTAWSALAVPFGQSGDQLIVWLTLLAFGLVVYLAFRLGAELFSPAVGAVAAIVVLTRPALVRDAGLGYQDVPFAALVVGAAVLEARTPRKGGAVLVLLAIAGLLRPEAWVLAGLYWLYLFPRLKTRERVNAALLVAAAPVLWALVDLAVTGDALHSLHGTSDLAEETGRRRDVGDAPYWTIQYYAYTLRQPLGVGIPIGVVFALRHRERFGRAAGLLLGLAAAMTLVFALNPIFGLPLIGRYVRTPSILLTVFFGVAVAGWALLEKGTERRVWQALAALTVVVFCIFIPANVRQIDYQREIFHRNAKLYDDLRKVGHSREVRALVKRCGTIDTADHRPIAHLRYWLDTDPGSVRTVEGRRRAKPELLLVPKPNVRNKLFFRENFPKAQPPPDAASVYDNRSWRLYAVSSCGSPASR
jgi:hypothetical protein